MPRASQVCTVSGCPNLQPCPTHRRVAWSGSDRAARLPPNWPKLRAQVRKRDRHICQGCGCSVGPDEGSVDHILRGDDHRLENLQLLCDPCHATKSGSEGAAARRGVG
jgi:5-methylcytosine-specific restriction endonuclease McrA